MSRSACGTPGGKHDPVATAKAADSRSDLLRLAREQGAERGKGRPVPRAIRVSRRPSTPPAVDILRSASVQWARMAFMDTEQRAQAVAISRLGHSNPFLPERIENERAVLGAGFTSTDAIWTVRADREVQNPNVARIGDLAGALAA